MKDPYRTPAAGRTGSVPPKDEGPAHGLPVCAPQENKLIYDLWMDSIRGLSPQKKRELAERWGGSRGVFEAGAAEICFAATGKNLREHPEGERWKAVFSTDMDQPERVLAVMEKKGISAAALTDPDYPASLLEIQDPPWLLYYRGCRPVWDRAGFGVVGARHCTEYGRWAAFELGGMLAGAGITVISGMAAGIDAEAHRGALRGDRDGGKDRSAGERAATIAVFGCGVDICYPRSNSKLMGEILERGAVVSEVPPGTEPRPYFFPRRNRIISGLSSGVAVMEAGLRSGSLITAGLAAEQGRDVFALPGDISRQASIGTNMLIRDGAVPIVAFADVLEELGLPIENDRNFTVRELGKDELELVREVSACGGATVDLLALRLGFSVGKVNALVTVLEMKGILRTALGKIFIAKS